MARRAGSNDVSPTGDRDSKLQVIKIRLDADDLKALRVAAAMKGERPSDLVRQILRAEIQRIFKEEAPKLLQSKEGKKK